LVRVTPSRISLPLIGAFPGLEREGTIESLV
jgi:hypothetical protein